MLLGKITNMRIQADGHKTRSGADERKTIEILAYKHNKVTYKQIRKALNTGEGWFF